MGRMVEDAEALFNFANSYEECMNNIEAISGRIQEDLNMAECYLMDEPSKKNIALVKEKIEMIRVVAATGQSLVDATRARATLIEGFLREHS